MLNKKGQGLSIETVVVILISITVFVVVILIFQSKGVDIFGSIKDFVSDVTVPQINYTDAIR